VRKGPGLRDLVVLAVLGAYAIPYAWQVLTSLKPEADLLRLPPLLPAQLTLEHYQVVLERSVLPRALGNSLAIALMTTVIAVVLGLLAAYAIARCPLPAKGWLLLGVVAATALPQIATVSPLYLLMRAFALRDTWTALVLAHTSLGLPLVVWLLAGFIREIPRELEQAASLDGADRRQIVRWIILPLAAPGVASVALLTFLLSWNEFLYAYTFSATDASRTGPVALALFPGVFEVPWGDIAAASILASLPPVLIVLALQRYLVRGLLAGALKE
jgi:multiple sugar transport system permease protein